VSTTVEQVTMGQPEEFSKYLQYCRNIMFEEKPDYNYLRGLFKGCMQRNGYEYDGRYDWIVKKEGGEKQIKAQLAKEEAKKGAHLPP